MHSRREAIEGPIDECCRKQETRPTDSSKSRNRTIVEQFPSIDSIAPNAANEESDQPLTETIKTILIGKPRDLADKGLFTHLSLVAFLAWVGLGADGLSSSCYGPAEAFRSLGSHSYLAVFLAIATIATVFVISTCYSHIIDIDTTQQEPRAREAAGKGLE